MKVGDLVKPKNPFNADGNVIGIIVRRTENGVGWYVQWNNQRCSIERKGYLEVVSESR